MEVLSPQCRWSFLVAKGVMVEVEEPVPSETRGLGEPAQVGGCLMTLARREQVRKHGSIGGWFTRTKEKDQKGRDLGEESRKTQSSQGGYRKSRLRNAHCIHK